MQLLLNVHIFNVYQRRKRKKIKVGGEGYWHFKSPGSQAEGERFATVREMQEWPTSSSAPLESEAAISNASIDSPVFGGHPGTCSVCASCSGNTCTAVSLGAEGGEWVTSTVLQELKSIKVNHNLPSKP